MYADLIIADGIGSVGLKQKQKWIFISLVWPLLEVLCYNGLRAGRARPNGWPGGRSYAFRCCVFFLGCNWELANFWAIAWFSSRTKLSESRGISKRTGITL